MGISSTGATTGGHQSSAAPASGKYGGFGNKDMEQMGYSNPTQTKYGGSSSGGVGGYDPYMNKSSGPVATT